MKSQHERPTHRVDAEVPRIGRYRVCYRIAQGGMASVYLARLEATSGFSKWVALKIIHPNIATEPRFVAMFLDEARIAARLDHPNLCTVFDFGEDDGRYYLAMEYLHGETLGNVARCAWSTQGALPCELAVRLVADAARGLHYAHEIKADDGSNANVVHRDVSPENIFVTYSGSAKVVDFGVARADDQFHERTTTGELKGKLAYMSPEQIHERRVDRRTDIWSLGVVLWEVTVGRRLFRRPTDAATVFAITRDPITLPSRLATDYPRDLEAIVMRALERDLTKRYQTAQDLCRALETWLVTSGRTVGATEVGEFMQALFADQIVWRDRFLRSPDPTFRDLVGEWHAPHLCPPSSPKPARRGIDRSPSRPADVVRAVPPDPPPRIPLLDDPDATTRAPEVPIDDEQATPLVRRLSKPGEHASVRRVATPAVHALARRVQTPAPREGSLPQEPTAQGPPTLPTQPSSSPGRGTPPGITPAPVERPSEVYVLPPRRKRWDVPVYLVGLMVLGALFAHIAWFDKPVVRRPSAPAPTTRDALPLLSTAPSKRARMTPDAHATAPENTTGVAPSVRARVTPDALPATVAPGRSDAPTSTSGSIHAASPPATDGTQGQPPVRVPRNHRHGDPTTELSAENRSLPGLLRVTATTHSEVFIGSRSLGWTPLNDVALPSGVYSIRVVSPEHTEAKEFIVTIRPRRTASLHVTWHDERAMPLAPSFTTRGTDP
jgi:serine/threonine-protein kinase